VPQVSVSTSGTGDKTLIDVATTSYGDVLDYLFFVSAAATIILKDEAGTVFGTYTLGAAGTIPAPAIGGANKRFQFHGDLIANVSAGTITGHVVYAMKS
jgi:hypothetical protein